MKIRHLNIRPIKLLLSACLATIMVAPLANAHTTVKSSTLEDGGVYQTLPEVFDLVFAQEVGLASLILKDTNGCLLYTSPSPRDRQKSRMPSSA